MRVNLIKALIFMATAFTAVAFFYPKNSVYASGYSLSVIAGNKEYVYSGREISVYNGKLYLNCIDGVIDGIFYDTALFPVDASVEFLPENDYPFKFESEKLGRGIDKVQLKKDIQKALYLMENTVDAKFIDLLPSVTVQSLKECAHKRAEFSTDYSSSSLNRKHNVKLSTEKINGAVVESGGEFSFNGIVGERSENNGFLSATVIENGEFSQGVGGGVCQVSTTLYNAVLLSGLTPTERHAHSLVPSYIEPSFDAMVSGSVCDLKFKNFTGGRIYIKGVANGEKVTFTVYGKVVDAIYQRESVVLEVIPPKEPEIIIDESLPTDFCEWIKAEKSGIKSVGNLKVTKNGITAITKLHTDVYKSVRGQKRVGANLLDKTCQVG